MTHYMQLLMENSPWNLIIFMAIPVILAETLAISELYLLFTRNSSGRVGKLSRGAGVVAGLYFAAVFAYLFFAAVLPITRGGEWRGVQDVIAVGSYLAGVVPLVGITLLELRMFKGKASENERLAWHAGFIALFLIVAHIAMIAGMLPVAVMPAAMH